EIAGRDRRHAVADRIDDSGSLVTEQVRELVTDAAFAVVQVGVAHAARLHAHRDFTRTRIRDDDRLHRHRFLDALGHDATYTLAHACRSWRLRRRAAGPRSLLGGIPASRRSLMLAALGACGAGPLGHAHCSAGYPPPDARSCLPL